MRRPLALLIMDGYGIAPQSPDNAITPDTSPLVTGYLSDLPNTLLGASGMDVGLPGGQMGNSEVGHTNIGAGRIVYQELTRITKSIVDGDFFENPAFMAASANVKATGGALHLIGLVSDGGVHSHMDHIFALVDFAKKSGVERLYIHCCLDGRDVPPKSGARFVADLTTKLNEVGVGKIATVMGRFYAMDRDSRWDRVERAYATMVYGEGMKNSDPVGAIEASYAEGVTDEFILPIVCDENGMIKGGDSVIFFNFRPDRAREITRAFVDPDFVGFPRKNGLFPLKYVCMTQYDASMPNVEVAFSPQSISDMFGEYISESGLTQLRIAETEKYAHVTFFFNGGIEQVCRGEDRVLIESPKVPTYDLKPEMSAYEVAEVAVTKIESGRYDVIILNFANCDMVGHTGIMEAAKKAVFAVDECVGMVVRAVVDMGGVAIVTADHGNADHMIEPDGTPFTAHSMSPVPFIVAGMDCNLRSGGVLADIAPTMLEILGLPKPDGMSGESLLIG